MFEHMRCTFQEGPIFVGHAKLPDKHVKQAMSHP